MKLYFEGGKKLVTDGVLLRNDNYYSVHNERFSGVNLTGEILSKKDDFKMAVKVQENDFSFKPSNMLGNKSLIQYSNIESLFAGMISSNSELNLNSKNIISIVPEEVELNF